MNESVVRKAEGIGAILDCVSSADDTISIDESDLRELMGDSEAAFFVEESAENVSGIKTAVANAFDKLHGVVEDEKPKKLIFKLMSDENLQLTEIQNVGELVASKCSEDADILWSHECSSELGEAVRITILIPAVG